MEIANQNTIQYDMSIDEQLKCVQEDWWNIMFLGNPCHEAQFEAIKQSKFAIKIIHDPCMEAQILHRNIHVIGVPIDFTCPACNEGKMNSLGIVQHLFCSIFIHLKCLESSGKPFSCAMCNENKILINENKDLFIENKNLFKENKNLFKDFVCPICLEEEKQIFARKLSCKHLFHDSCISRWFQEKKTCPCCRSF